ncbi:LOW QUALITY PROTEIN: transmembrane protein 165 [Acyrthosiphon pisum]|uniref:GDT1 family protein n=1 Tax=Acyrthosiphon pisum TaxID=7029 RepID=A0A8R2A3B9_ACYPI|nr:LOW QUALITY PROTEIN: transmembrane protein 165 [Acyrthosiphon pisum]|eukprot:XP_001945318.2 PREDICTED: LOW QUALITY PROTEIN: transmembrane protein 165 [Acyrthosiphon pisum]
MFGKVSVLCVVLIATAIASSLPVDENEDLLPTLVPDIGDSLTSEQTTKHTPTVSLGLVHAFVASLSVIIVSELGDKTFFIAAIMAMRHSRITVFTGAISALALMTVLSVLFGYAATVIPRAYTYYISTALFAVFGLKMLREGFKMSPNEGQDELEEVQANLRRKDDENKKNNKDASPVTEKDDKSPAVMPSVVETINVTVDNSTDFKDADIEQQAPKRCRLRFGSKSLLIVSKTLIQAFTMTFLAEWGDRSQLATIILAAREDAYGVALGGVLGHSLCTGLAVIGGRFIAQKISVRTVTIVGGVVFIMFAVTALMFDPNEGES